MIQARLIAAYMAAVDATSSGDDPSAAGTTVARLPDGYDRTDLRVLEWIVKSRGASLAKPSGVGRP